MPSIPLFDSLMHPMPNGGWLSSRYSGANHIEKQVDSMRQNAIRWGLAVGLGPSIGGYQEEKYADFVLQAAANIYPVAYCDFSKLSQATDVERYLVGLKKLGYIAIKIHPRIAGVSYAHPLMPAIIVAANDIGLGVLLCTYFWSKCGGYGEDGIDGLMSLLVKVPEQKVILLHGGGVRLLEVAEIVRQFPNSLLDVSFTLCKYEGSSLDLDIKYLFNNFDRRICVGSDSPEFTHQDLRRRFDHFATGLSESKSSNIAHRNILAHLNLVTAHETPGQG